MFYFTWLLGCFGLGMCGAGIFMAETPVGVIVYTIGIMINTGTLLLSAYGLREARQWPFN